MRRNQDDQVNKYIRERIRQVRTDVDDTQEDIAKRLEKTRVAVSDMERGRVAVSAADLVIISNYYKKPISYFFPEMVKVGKGELSPLDEELIMLFRELPETLTTHHNRICKATIGN